MKKTRGIDLEEVFRKDNPKEYQEALLFRLSFQKSKQCLLFRVAWGIFGYGFKNYGEYNEWYKNLIEKTNTYYKSKKEKDRKNKILEKRKELSDGKITDTDFRFFAHRSTFAIPLNKYNYDIDQITIHSGKPIYWRDYIEECLIFETPLSFFPIRPLPEPELKWDFENQFYELIIENVFPDTTTKDFDRKEFTEKLKKLQKKLPGYKDKKTRVKRSFDFGMKVKSLDDTTKLTDWEKGEEIEGEAEFENFGSIEKRRKNKVKQARHRFKGYMS